MRSQLRLIGMAVATAAVLALPASAAADGDDVLYVALGDSVATGVGASSPSNGYVERAFSHFQSSLGVTQLSNRAREGETSGTLRTNGQLDSALADIDAPSDTRVVTIDIGLHERDACAAKWSFDPWSSCPFRNNLSATLSDLREALRDDPGADSLVVMANYNPAAGLGGDAPFSGESWYERLLLGSNREVDCRLSAGPKVGETDVVYQEAASHAALVADTYPAFTRGGRQLMADSTYPNDAGHAAIASLFTVASAPCTDVPDPAASPRSFRVVRVQKNKRRGTAKLTVEVPGPGIVSLARNGRLKAAEADAEEAGRVKLSVRPRREAKEMLDADGSAGVRAEVVYTQDGEDPATTIRRLKLVRRG